MSEPEKTPIDSTSEASDVHGLDDFKRFLGARASVIIAVNSPQEALFVYQQRQAETRRQTHEPERPETDLLF